MKEYNKIIRELPNICTLMNAICGIVALLISVFYKSFAAINVACMLIAVGGFFDAIDGRLARRLKLSSEIGKQLDSFADSITFGITPMCAFLAVHSIGNTNKISLPEIFIASFYISCAVYRLARYNVSDYTNYFIGLPTTAAGIFMSFYTLTSNLLMNKWENNIYYTYFSYTLIILLGIGMISTIKVNRI